MGEGLRLLVLVSLVLSSVSVWGMSCTDRVANSPRPLLYPSASALYNAHPWVGREVQFLQDPKRTLFHLSQLDDLQQFFYLVIPFEEEFLAVMYREVRGGFQVVFLPSKDLNFVLAVRNFFYHARKYLQLKDDGTNYFIEVAAAGQADDNTELMQSLQLAMKGFDARAYNTTVSEYQGLKKNRPKSWARLLRSLDPPLGDREGLVISYYFLSPETWDR